MKKVLIVIGTRPNYMKVTRFKNVIRERNLPIDCRVVHTNQHQDASMSKVFFEQLQLTPDFFLNIRHSSVTTQIADIITGIETLVKETFFPDLMLVVGDVTSTLAAAICANKLGIKLAHVESGLRSFDRSMPEEINRILTDQISDYCFVTENSGLENLRAEGKDMNRVFFVGNTMIDTLANFETSIRAQQTAKKLGITAEKFATMTMHRPSNVDSESGLKMVVDLLLAVSTRIQVVFPIHPRTRKNLQQRGLLSQIENSSTILLTQPLDYFQFQSLIMDSKLVITDSGGIQEETTFLKTPCLTLRPNTERPVTITLGSNVLLSFDIAEILKQIDKIISEQWKESTIPPLWDGRATERILEVVAREIL